VAAADEAAADATKGEEATGAAAAVFKLGSATGRGRTAFATTPPFVERVK
jgi:hypothetical protein